MLRAVVLRTRSTGVIAADARGAWRDLEQRLRPFVARRVQSAADVDDVVQDVLLRMHRGLGALRDEERFGPWVYRVARNAVLDHRRRAQRLPAADPDSVSDEAIIEGVEALDDAEAVLASYVATFVAMLPSPYREALTLTELEGLTQREAAEMLGVSLTAMKSRVARGRRELRKAFEDCCVIGLDARGHVVACEPRKDGKIPGCCC